MLYNDVYWKFFYLFIEVKIIKLFKYSIFIIIIIINIVIIINKAEIIWRTTILVKLK